MGMCTEPSIQPFARSEFRRTSRTTTSCGARGRRGPAKVERGKEAGSSPSRAARRRGRRWRRRPGGRCPPAPVHAGRRRAARPSVGEQGDRLAPRDQPGQVGGELALGLEVERPGHMPLGEGDPVAQVDHPLPGREPRRDLARRPRARAGSGRPGRGRRRWPGPCARSRRARPPGRPAGPRDEGVHVDGERVVARASPCRWWSRPPRPGRRSRSCRSRGWAAPPSRRAARSARRWAEACWARASCFGQPRLDQVRAAHGADQQRPAGEDATAAPASSQHVGGVVRGVARGRDRAQRHQAAGVDADRVAVRDGNAGEGDVRGGRHEVAGAGDRGRVRGRR